MLMFHAGILQDLGPNNNDQTDRSTYLNDKTNDFMTQPNKQETTTN